MLDSAISFVSRRHFRGKWRVFHTLRRLGLLGGHGRYAFGSRHVILPLDNWQTWKLSRADDYASLRVERVCKVINQRSRGVDLVDLGANIGLIACQFATRLDNLSSILAVEPNGQCRAYLEYNLSRFHDNWRIVAGAISDFSGMGALVVKKHDSTDHGAYLVSDPSGDVPVSTVDEIYEPASEDLLLKIDVEGHEVAALRGARQAIASAARVYLYLEIHPKVLERVGREPNEVFREVGGIRDMAWYIPDDDMRPIDPGVPFFSQVTDVRQYDVLGIARPA